MVEFKKIQKFSEKEFELIKITQDVREFVENSKVRNGVVFVIVSHTTAGIMVNESLPCLERDIETKLEGMAVFHVGIWLPTHATVEGDGQISGQAQFVNGKQLGVIGIETVLGGVELQSF